MRVPGALRSARRAAGEDDGGGVARVDRSRGRRGRIARQRGHDPCRASPQVIGVEPEDLGQLREVGAHRLDDCAKVHVVPAVDGEEQPRARLPEQVTDLAPPVADVDPRGHRAQPSRGEVGDQIQRGGGQQQRDDAAALDPVRPERGGQPVGQRVPVAIGEPLVPIAEGLGVGRLACGRAQQIA